MAGGRIAILAVFLLRCAGGQTAAGRSAVAAMQRGDFAGAEQMLRAELQSHPDDPWTLSLLGVALDNEKKLGEAAVFHQRAVSAAPRSAEILTNYGTHYWSAGEYAKAEGLFADALAAAPSFFTALLNLGIMATYTGHYDRAREALNGALALKPQNVEVLYRLAVVEDASKQWESAVMHLAQAARLAPRRADVQRLLAAAATSLGALEDAIAAWDRYLELAPGDDIALRERAYAWAGVGKIDQGVSGLQTYVARHPDDPVGFYELAQAERTVHVDQALSHLDQALALKPDSAAALSARGALYYQEGKPALALPDLERAAALAPDDAVTLDRLGQTYQALDRPADAVRCLRKAAELAPEDSKTILHFGRALADAGETGESRAVMERFRQLGPDRGKGIPAGLVEYLALPAAERRAGYRKRVEAAVRDHPDDPAAQLELLKLQIEEGGAGEVADTAQRLVRMKAGSAVLSQAGRALQEAGYDVAAKGLLEQAAAAGAAVSLELALANLHLAGEAAGGAAFERTLAPAARPDLYLRESAFLLKQGRVSDALYVINSAARAFPDDREILLQKSIALQLAGQPGGALPLIDSLQARWPEWSLAWLARGMLLDARGRFDEACQAFGNAAALGARRPDAYFYLAGCALRAKRPDDALAAIDNALSLAPGDPWIQLLAGQIAFERGQTNLALERRNAALGLRPQWAKPLADHPYSGGTVEPFAPLPRAEAPPYLYRFFAH